MTRRPAHLLEAFALGLLFLAPSLAAGAETNLPPRSKKGIGGEWLFLDNGQLRIGISKSSGGCIGYFSPSRSRRNLLNSHDRGRFIRQSYYGDEDGTKWGDQPWRWNPVQGGDYRGGGAQVLDIRIQSASLYARTRPRHWAACVDLPEVSMEEWITLTGKVAHVHYKMTYAGTNAHAARRQEIPAFFAQPDLDTLVLYDGEKPWTGAAVTRSKPGQPNELRRISEHWAAYVDQKDFGVGAYVPMAEELTCGRYGKGSATSGACSYFAPLTAFAIMPGCVFEYDLYLTVGKTAEIRETIRRLRLEPATKAAR